MVRRYSKSDLRRMVEDAPEQGVKKNEPDLKLVKS
jgi:hypothetical protein